MSKNQKLQTIPNGMAGLKEVTKSLKPQVPKLCALSDLSGLGGTVEGKIKLAYQIQEDVANALRFLTEVSKQIASYGVNRLARKIAVSETAKNVAEMNEYLNGVLALEDPIFRQVAAVAYIVSALSGDFEAYKDASAALRDIEGRGILLKDSEGPIMIGYQRYSVAEKFGVSKEEISDLNEKVAKFSRCLTGLIHQQRQDKVKELNAKADISLDQALAGKDGKCSLLVPAESYLDREGKEQWRGGGTLLVEFTAKEVLPVSGAASIENAVEGMVKADVRLQRHTLIWITPPAHGNTAFERVKTGVMDTLGLGEEEAEAYVNKMKALWWLIRRTVKAVENKKAMEKLKEEFRNKANITPMQIFGLNGSGHVHQGKACLEFEGAFHRKSGQPSIYGLFFLLARGQEGDKDVVEVVEVPKHLEKDLGDFVGKKFPAENNFSNCPLQLGRILREIRGQLDMAHEIAKE